MWVVEVETHSLLYLHLCVKSAPKLHADNSLEKHNGKTALDTADTECLKWNSVYTENLPLLRF